MLRTSAPLIGALGVTIGVIEVSKDEQLTRLANSAGFVFQLGIEHTIRESTNEHSWSVVSREHPWELEDATGFIDLIAVKGFATAVIECKRTTDAVWLFLVPKEEAKPVGWSKLLWVAGGKPNRVLSGHDPVMHHPQSVTSSFCIVRGAGESDRPMLERICATLLKSVEGLADSETEMLRKRSPEYCGFYIPIILTNAELQICRLDPALVDIEKGVVANAEFEEVPYIRFQKAFTTSLPDSANPKDLTSFASAHERSVFVVQASRLVEFLTSFREISASQPYPWNAHFPSHA